MKHFFWHLAIQCLEESVPFLNSCNSVLPGSHSSYFFHSATSKGFYPHIQKAELALHYSLQFAPKSSFSHPEGDAVWSEELYGAGGHSRDRPPLGVITYGQRLHRGLGERGAPTITPSSRSTSKSPCHLPARHFFGTAGGNAGAE